MSRVIVPIISRKIIFFSVLFFLISICIWSKNAVAEQFLSLQVSAPSSVLEIGDSLQLTVIGIKTNGTQVDVTDVSTGTRYDNEDGFVDISTEGLVTINGARFRSVQETYTVWIVTTQVYPA